MHDRKPRAIVALALVLAAILTVAGCGGGVIAQVLRINSARALVDTDWSSSGGWVKILADITGYSAITDVIAIVKKIGSSETQQIKLVSNAQGQFEGVFRAEENTSPTAPEEYTVTITATDGATTAESRPVTVEVPPAE